MTGSLRADKARAVHGWAPLLAVVLLAVMLAGCDGGGRAELAAGKSAVADPGGVAMDDEPITTTTTLPVPTTSAVSTTAPQIGLPTTTAPPPPGLGVGSEGAPVLALEKKLDALHYYTGTVDTSYDGDTRDAVLAFQKVTGMDRTGRATDDVVAAINAAAEPKPMVPAGGFRRVEVDLDRQVLFLYEGNNLDTILNVSTGSNQRFCSEGWCRVAVTPPGSFVINQQDSGWETGPLGSLYNAQYFNGGIAIHGSTSVPAYPASHGCVRISMNAAEWFPDKVSVGTPVYVLDSDDLNPTPIGGVTPVSTPTTIVRDTTTTTAPNLLNQLLAPITKKP